MPVSLSSGSVNPRPRRCLSSASHPGGEQLGAEELIGDLVGVQEPLPLAHFLTAGPRAAVLVAELVPDPGGQLFDGLVEGGVIQFLHEGDDVAVLAAAEAVVAAHLRADGERRRALVVEGAQSLVGAEAGTLERDV